MTLGCKQNQAESEAITRELQEAGYCIVSSEVKADVYILNTCTVTHVADRKSRHFIRMIHRENPEAKIVVTGCYAQRAARELQEIKGTALVLGNSQKPYLKKILDELTGSIQYGRTRGKPDKPERTRSFIKIQDGCNNFCSFCIVPLVRGREISLPEELIIEQVKQRSLDGYQEIVLTGTEIGRYRYGSKDLTQLIKNILAETEIPRLRLSSFQPQEITKELLSLWENSRLCRHLHLSLQSGSKNILHLMNRRYSLDEYVATVLKIRSAISDVAITTDVIVGFPGESQDEFLESMEFCRMIGFARIHVFPFSIREGTRAASIPVQINPSVKNQRMENMLNLARTSQESFNKGFVGRRLHVLFEQKSGDLWSGLTDNYIKVYAKSNKPLTNMLLPVEIIELLDDGVLGRIKE